MKPLGPVQRTAVWNGWAGLSAYRGGSQRHRAPSAAGFPYSPFVSFLIFPPSLPVVSSCLHYFSLYLLRSPMFPLSLHHFFLTVLHFPFMSPIFPISPSFFTLPCLTSPCFSHCSPSFLLNVCHFSCSSIFPCSTSFSRLLSHLLLLSLIFLTIFQSP